MFRHSFHRILNKVEALCTEQHQWGCYRAGGHSVSSSSLQSPGMHRACEPLPNATSLNAEAPYCFHRSPPGLLPGGHQFGAPPLGPLFSPTKRSLCPVCTHVLNRTSSPAFSSLNTSGTQPPGGAAAVHSVPDIALSPGVETHTFLRWVLLTPRFYKRN